jgi:uncharacterized tellurite resistance protein B-like protein
MIDRIKSFFNAAVKSGIRDSTEEVLHRKRLVAAALMIEVLRSDFEHHEREWAAIRQALEENLQLTGQEIEQIIELADEEVEHAVSLHGFTRYINDNYSQQEKITLMEMLWRIAWADSVLSSHEQHLMRKIASLLYIPHKDYIGAKQRARKHKSLQTGDRVRQQQS